MKTIKLTNTDLVAIVDDEDYELVNQYRWRVIKQKTGKINSVHAQPYENGKVKSVYMHRLIMNPPDRYVFIDHINRNPLDNRKENLRFCNNQQNCMNRTKPNPTGYKGVHKRVDGRNKGTRYRAYIFVDGKQKSLGTFSTPEEAALRYNEAAKEYFGEFALLNEVD